MPLVGDPQSNEMTRDEEDEHNTSLAVDNPDDKPEASPRRRKKVVTFASLADLAEIQALTTYEADSQALELDKADCSEEPTPPALSDPSHFLNMPLEDYDATSNNVSTAKTSPIPTWYVTSPGALSISLVPISQQIWKARDHVK